jgi:hypothetical protein
MELRHMSRLVSHLLCAGLAALTFVALPASAQMAPPPPRNVYFALFGGISGGGDEVARVRFADGYTESIDAGGLLHLAAGVVVQLPQTPLALQATIGWQADSVYASNGDISFTRYPIELLGFWHPAPHWRLGAGARFVNGAEFESDVNGFNDTVTYEDTVGLVIETGLQVFPGGWVNLRYVDESYEPESINGINVTSSGKVSGRSVGLNLLWTF